MGKKHYVDPGLAYLMQINFERARGVHALNDRLIRVYGKEECERIYEKRVQYEDGSKDFYDFKNSSLKLSTCFSEAYDGDIIRSACNYISDNKEYFGSTILEVGCESGYITGFLALTFPEAHIVAIDRSEKAISVAKERLIPLNVTNVEFRVSSVQDMTEKFNTVLSIRTLQENWSSESYKSFGGDPLPMQLAAFTDMTKEYADSLTSLLVDDGALISVERCGVDPLLYGWMSSLTACGCGILETSLKSMECEECSEVSHFQAVIAKKDADCLSEEEIYELWHQKLDVSPKSNGVLYSYPAVAYLMENEGDLIYGYYILGDEDCRVGKFALYSDKDDDKLVYYYCVIGEEQTLYSYTSALKEDIMAQIDEQVKYNVQAGLKSEKITSIDQ